ncbi:MAG: NADPH-dependent 7-cyano-7-deazaguanine reductase QueF [Woeseiaceae bacterium]|nr:NADPH-dependent 7-cyano-7-deazaguanine reductase QueF [Woeseiaceae bacterium]
MNDSKLPLGQITSYPDQYAPELLYPIARADSRRALGIVNELPFHGVDIWNAWELTWLGEGNLPAVATAVIEIPADSPAIVESKSLKLYLNSFAMSVYRSAGELAEIIRRDIGAAVGCGVNVRVQAVARTEAQPLSRLAGTCLDGLPVQCSAWEVDAGLIEADSSHHVSEDLHSHLLRSLCPVTSQPDIGSVQISYRGPKIDRASLLRYIVSFRRHNEFHEACVERIYMDVMARCEPEALSVQARYQRRGGIDINPFRSSRDERPVNRRLWRQ